MSALIGLMSLASSLVVLALLLALCWLMGVYFGARLPLPFVVRGLPLAVAFCLPAAVAFVATMIAVDCWSASPVVACALLAGSALVLDWVRGQLVWLSEWVGA